MIRHLTSLFLLLVLFIGAGGHWMTLQTAAWSSMMVRYVNENGLAAGLRKTFDGSQACELCKVAQKSASAPASPGQNNGTGKRFTLKTELFLEVSLNVAACASADGRATDSLPLAQRGMTRATEPATPPPRAA